MRRWRLALACAAMAVASCGGEAREPVPDRNSPFGVWRSQSGAVLTVERSGTYRLCDSAGCDSGKAEIVFAGSGANLLGFWDLPAGRRLSEHLVRSGSSSPKPESAVFQVATGKIPATSEERLCGDRPCVLIGSISDADPERFEKVEDQ